MGVKSKKAVKKLQRGQTVVERFDLITVFYADVVDAVDLDDFIATHELHQGVPLFNTIAVSDDGRAWYADTSATPNLSADSYVKASKNKTLLRYFAFLRKTPYLSPPEEPFMTVSMLSKVGPM